MSNIDLSEQFTDIIVTQRGFQSNAKTITTADTLLETVLSLKLTKPQDDPVYLFLLKKEQEGKPYNVAKMAAVNKFLRIYYARAMELYK